MGDERLDKSPRPEIKRRIAAAVKLYEMIGQQVCKDLPQPFLGENLAVRCEPLPNEVEVIARKAALCNFTGLDLDLGCLGLLDVNVLRNTAVLLVCPDRLA